MAHIARALGLGRERVIAVGDSGNDSDMLVACSNPVLVANCEPGLRALPLAPHAVLSALPHARGVVDGVRAHLARWGAAETKRAA